MYFLADGPGNKPFVAHADERVVERLAGHLVHRQAPVQFDLDANGPPGHGLLDVVEEYHHGFILVLFESGRRRPVFDLHAFDGGYGNVELVTEGAPEFTAAVQRSDDIPDRHDPVVFVDREGRAVPDHHVIHVVIALARPQILESQRADHRVARHVGILLVTGVGRRAVGVVNGIGRIGVHIEKHVLIVVVAAILEAEHGFAAHFVVKADHIAAVPRIELIVRIARRVFRTGDIEFSGIVISRNFIRIGQHEPAHSRTGWENVGSLASPETGQPQLFAEKQGCRPIAATRPQIVRVVEIGRKRRAVGEGHVLGQRIELGLRPGRVLRIIIIITDGIAPCCQFCGEHQRQMGILRHIEVDHPGRHGVFRIVDARHQYVLNAVHHPRRCLCVIRCDIQVGFLTIHCTEDVERFAFPSPVAELLHVIRIGRIGTGRRNPVGNRGAGDLPGRLFVELPHVARNTAGSHVGLDTGGETVGFAIHVHLAYGSREVDHSRIFTVVIGIGPEQGFYAGFQSKRTVHGIHRVLGINFKQRLAAPAGIVQIKRNIPRRGVIVFISALGRVIRAGNFIRPFDTAGR